MVHILVEAYSGWKHTHDWQLAIISLTLEWHSLLNLIILFYLLIKCEIVKWRKWLQFIHSNRIRVIHSNPSDIQAIWNAREVDVLVQWSFWQASWVLLDCIELITLYFYIVILYLDYSDALKQVWFFEVEFSHSRLLLIGARYTICSFFWLRIIL